MTSTPLEKSLKTKPGPTPLPKAIKDLSPAFDNNGPVKPVLPGAKSTAHTPRKTYI